VDERGEEVHADERQIRRRVLGLLDQSHDVAVVVDLGDAEALGIGHRAQSRICAAGGSEPFVQRQFAAV
jgi:hypothetical protein